MIELTWAESAMVAAAAGLPAVLFHLAVFVAARRAAISGQHISFIPPLVGGFFGVALFIGASLALHLEWLRVLVLAPVPVALDIGAYLLAELAMRRHRA